MIFKGTLRLNKRAAFFDKVLNPSYCVAISPTSIVSQF